MDSQDDIVIKMIIISNGARVEVQKRAWDVRDVTIGKLEKNVKGSSQVPREVGGDVGSLDYGAYLVVELYWMDKSGDQVRLQKPEELALALKEMKGAGLTVTANVFLESWSC